MNSPILVLTSTGTVGSAVVNALVEAGVPVRAATRDPQAQPKRAGVDYIAFDFADTSSFEAALNGVERVFVLSPGGDDALETLTPFIEKASTDKNRKLVFMSALGVDADDSNALRQVELMIENTGVPHVFLRPNWFMDNFYSYWAEQIKSGTIIVPAADSRTSFIDVRDIAAAAAAVLQTDQHDNQAFALTGPEALTYAEAATIISQELGYDVTYSDIEGPAFVAMLQEHGIPAEYSQLMAGLFEFVRAGYMAPTSAAVKTLTGRDPYRLQQNVRDNAEKLSRDARTA